MFARFTQISVLAGLMAFWAGCQGLVNGSGNNPPPPNSPISLSVTIAGVQGGTVISSPNGIDCGSTCSATFNTGTSVTLTANAPGGGQFTGWSGSCSGSEMTCTISQGGSQSVTATFSGSLQSINHIVFMV